MWSFYQHARLPAGSANCSDDDRASDFVPPSKGVYQRGGAVFAFTHVFGAGGFASDFFLDPPPVAQQIAGRDLSALGMRFEASSADSVLKRRKFKLHPIVVHAGNTVKLAAGGRPAQFLGRPPDGGDDVFALHVGE